MAPGIRDTDARSLPELMALMRGLVQRARTGGLRSSELTSPSITVTSLGDRGAETVTGIIYPPQVAIEPRPVVGLSLAADHRASDGHTGGRLLNAIERLLQEPTKL